MKWLKRLLGRDAPRVVVVRTPLLGTEQARMTEEEIRKAIFTGRDAPAFRALVQLVEDYSLNAIHMAKWDQRILDGTSTMYLGASGYLDDILADVKDLLENKPRELAASQLRKQMLVES